MLANVGRFVLLGIEHILSGYDHIAFLVALVVVAPSLRAVLPIITAFTAAHSITLLLAALRLVSLNSRLVESAMLNLTIPEIYLHRTETPDSRSHYAIVDGRQRCTTLFCFYHNQNPWNEGEDFRLFGCKRMPGLNGLAFKDFTPTMRQTFLNYKLGYTHATGVDGEAVSELFQLLNRNTMPLTVQEIRNASFQKTSISSAVIAWKHQAGPKKSWTRRRIRANLLGMTCPQRVEPKKPEVPMNISSAWRRHFRLLPVSKIAFLLFPLIPVAAHALADQQLAQVVQAPRIVRVEFQ